MTFLRAALVLSCVVLSACARQPDSAVERYVERLANVLEVDPNPVDFDVPRFPDTRDLSPTQPNASLSVREFLSLRQCQLHSVLATKNSLLGKLAEASQTLLVDLQILRLGPPCVTQLRADQQLILADKLEQALNTKTTGIRTLLWQALLAEAEHRAFWSMTTQLENYPHKIDDRIVAALTELAQFSAQVRDGDYDLSTAQASRLEQQLGILREGDGGHLLREFSLLTQGLDRANQMIGQRLARPLCLNNAPTPKARHFKNVVSKFLIGEVQPHAVALRQRFHQLLPALYALERPLLDHATPAYRAWARQRDQVFERGLGALRTHVEQIQRLFSQCGLQAG